MCFERRKLLLYLNLWLKFSQIYGVADYLLEFYHTRLLYLLENCES